jgi:hypothetical protein
MTLASNNSDHLANRSNRKCDERREVARKPPAEGLRGTGGAAKTLPAKRGTVRFAVTVRVLSAIYEP